MNEFDKTQKNQIKNEISNLKFYRNLHVYLAGGYLFATTCSIGEFISNNFKFGELYVPIILGSVTIMINAFKTTKNSNYKLKQFKTELCMIEFKEAVEEKMEGYKYLSKK